MISTQRVADGSGMLVSGKTSRMMEKIPKKTPITRNSDAFSILKSAAPTNVASGTIAMVIDSTPALT